jgi:hypothetical protein
VAEERAGKVSRVEKIIEEVIGENSLVLWRVLNFSLKVPRTGNAGKTKTVLKVNCVTLGRRIKYEGGRSGAH